MDKALLVFRKTIKYSNKNNQEKGYKVKYSVWKKTDFDALCQVIVKCIPDSVTKDKFILLDLSLDIQGETTYLIDDIITSLYQLS